MSLTTVEAQVKTIVSKLEADFVAAKAKVLADANLVESDIKSFWEKTYTAKVVVVVALSALVLGAVLAKVL